MTINKFIENMKYNSNIEKLLCTTHLNNKHLTSI